MKTKYTKEQIEEAIKQAEANIGFEDVELEQIKEENKVRILRKEKNEYRK